MSDDYILKLDNKGKIANIDKKIVSTQIKIDKYESRRLIIKKCVQEMENKLYGIQNKAFQHPENEKIADEIEDTQNKIKEGQKILHKLNEKLSRSEISLLKLKQDRKEEIRGGLEKYKNLLNLRYEELQKEGISTDKSHGDGQHILKEIEKEIGHIKRLIEIESKSR